MKILRAFTLIELMVVVGIIGLLAGIVVVAANPALKKGRDAKRKADLGQIGRVLTGGGCYQPDAGPGDYDIGALIPEVKAKYPQYAAFLSAPPKDPRGGTVEVTKYRYVLAADGKSCAAYANLENENERLTITGVSEPTPGGGSGVLQGAAAGANGTTVFFQVSN